MRLTTDQQEFDVYVRHWEILKKDFFKLETLQMYADAPGFQEYQQGKIDEVRKLLKDSLLSDTASPHEKIKKIGIIFRRVHVIKLPLTSYLRYEIESYKISTQLGEQIFFMLEEDAIKLKREVEPRDFLLFDDKIVHLQYYDMLTGKWKYTELLKDQAEVRDYVNLKRQLLINAIPMYKFLQRYIKKGGNNSLNNDFG